MVWLNNGGVLPLLSNFRFLLFFCPEFEIMTFFAISPSLISCSTKIPPLNAVTRGSGLHCGALIAHSGGVTLTLPCPSGLALLLPPHLPHLSDSRQFSHLFPLRVSALVWPISPVDSWLCSWYPVFTCPHSERADHLISIYFYVFPPENLPFVFSLL